MRIRYLVAAALLCATLPTWAQNLLVNPNFDADLSGWTFSTNNGGTAVWDGTDGSPALGSVQFSSSSPGITQLTQCILLSGGQTQYEVSWAWKPATMYDTVALESWVTIDVYTYASTDCSGAGNHPFTDAGAGGLVFWNSRSYPITLVAGQHSASVNLWLGTSSVSGIYNVDGVSFSNATTPVRLQDFSVD